MTVEIGYRYFVDASPASDRAMVHVEECDSVGEAGQRRLIGVTWTRPIEGWEALAEEFGDRKILLCAECEPEPNPCDPDSYDDYVFENHLKGDVED